MAPVKMQTASEFFVQIMQKKPNQFSKGMKIMSFMMKVVNSFIIMVKLIFLLFVQNGRIVKGY